MSNASNPAQMWDERYAAQEFAYGEHPNVYFQEKIAQLQPGRLLLPAEGEGRNAAFALSLGWKVDAFDISKGGKAKAESLAKENLVNLNYQVLGVEAVQYPANHFDAIGFTYTHFPSADRPEIFSKMLQTLKPGGFVMLEVFGKKQLEYQAHQNSGGPRVPDLLFSLEEMPELFAGFEVKELLQGEIRLTEGIYHQGQAWVIRFLGRKPID